jgi:hypothetical protein
VSDVTPSVASILRQIRKLTPSARGRLAAALADRPDLLGNEYVTIDAATLDLLRRLNTNALDREKELVALLVDRANAAARRAKCARVKHERVARRNEVIDKLAEVGTTDPEQILAHLIEHYPELVKKGRKGRVGAEQVVDAYRRAKAGGRKSQSPP